MIKRMISGCLVFAFCFFVRNVNAASTCDYKDQVELSNVASTIKTGYEIKKVVMDENENILDADPDSVLFGSDFFIVSTLHGYVHNLTQDVYVKITNDEGFEKIYHYSDTDHGNISFVRKDLSKIARYKVEVFSDKVECRDELLRTIDFVTPMKNEYAFFTDCEAIPDFEYCKQYISTPFLASDSEITSQISKAYQKYVDGLKEEEEEKNKSFFEKVGDFFRRNQVIIYSVLGIIIVVGALTTVVIIKKRRSRVL